MHNVEVQKASKGAIPERARHNSSLLDANALKKRVEHDALPDAYVIFITENDTFKRSEPIYHIEGVIMETGELFGDREHIMYVNGEYEGTDAIGWLMHDFREVDPNEMHYNALSDRARLIKKTE